MRSRFSSILVFTVAAMACNRGDYARADTMALMNGRNAPHLRIAIVGAPDDPRQSPARAAIGFWNGEFARLGRRLTMDSAIVVDRRIPDDDLRAASGEAMMGGGPATTKLRNMLRAIPADVVVVFSNTDLISFSSRWDAGTLGIVGVRRSDVPPLTLPNTVQNVIAHELGHVLGLPHNEDPKTLMCGRPAPCRPAAFASEKPHFFPLTADDETVIRSRWP